MCVYVYILLYTEIYWRIYTKADLVKVCSDINMPYVGHHAITWNIFTYC